MISIDNAEHRAHDARYGIATDATDPSLTSTRAVEPSLQAFATSVDTGDSTTERALVSWSARAVVSGMIVADASAAM